MPFVEVKYRCARQGCKTYGVREVDLVEREEGGCDDGCCRHGTGEFYLSMSKYDAPEGWLKSDRYYSPQFYCSTECHDLDRE